MPLVEIKYFDALIDNKPFFDQSVKNKQESYKNFAKMWRNNNYTTETLLDYQKHCTLIVIELSRQTDTSIQQQFLFVGKLKEDEDATMFSVAEKQQQTILKIFYFIH